jgi:hypothetical protein
LKWINTNRNYKKSLRNRAASTMARPSQDGEARPISAFCPEGEAGDSSPFGARWGEAGRGRRASPGGGGPDLGYGKVRGLPTAAGDGGASWVEVDVGKRLEEGSKLELERSVSGTLVRWSSSTVQLGRGITGGGWHRRGAHGGWRTQSGLLWPHGGRRLEGDSFPEEGLEHTRAEARGVLTRRLVGDVRWEALHGDWPSRGRALYGSRVRHTSRREARREGKLRLALSWAGIRTSSACGRRSADSVGVRWWVMAKPPWRLHACMGARWPGHAVTRCRMADKCALGCLLYN